MDLRNLLIAAVITLVLMYAVITSTPQELASGEAFLNNPIIGTILVLGLLVSVMYFALLKGAQHFGIAMREAGIKNPGAAIALMAVIMLVLMFGGRF